MLVGLVACSPDQVPPKLCIDLESKGTYTTGLIARGAGSYAPFIFVADGRGSTRIPGGRVEDDRLRIRIEVVDSSRRSVFSSEYGATQMVYGNWAPPDTAIVLDSGLVELERAMTYEIKLEVIAETHTYGAHPTALVLTRGAK
jgi:hypothetical protein